MAERIISCKKSGQVFTFSDQWNTEEGRVRQLSYKLQAGKSILPHSHPKTSQSFQVISGQLTIRAGFKKKVLLPGDVASTKEGGQHSQWNDAKETVEVIESYQPPIDIEPFFTVLPYIENEYNFLKQMVFFSDFSYAVTSKSLLAKLIIVLFGKIGNLCGYKYWYIEYIKNLKCPDFKKYHGEVF